MIDVTLLPDFDLYFRFQMFKICEIRSFRMLLEANTMKNIQQYTLKHLRSNIVSPVFLLRDLYLHFRFEMFNIYEIRLFSYVAG